MNAIELLQTEHRILAGLIGQVWSKELTEQDDPLARANVELYIRMYLEETMLQHRTQGPIAAGPDDLKESN